jgi:hypothetical protein
VLLQTARLAVALLAIAAPSPARPPHGVYRIPQHNNVAERFKLFQELVPRRASVTP